MPSGYDGRWSWQRVHKVEGLEERAVILTLDVGARLPNLEKVLDVLKAQDVKTTIFLYSGELERSERAGAILGRMISDGHELANHTLSHQDLTTMSEAEVDMQLDRVDALTERWVQTSTRPFFREPFLATNTALDEQIKKKCYRTIWFTVDTADWKEGATAAGIERAVFEHRGKPRVIESGSIFIFHGSQKENLVALPRIITRLREQGFSFLRLSDALKRAR